MATERNSILIGNLAKNAGISTDTIRYYERFGLLPHPERTTKGYRLYNSKAVDQIYFIQKAQKLGFSLEEIKQVLELRGSGEFPCESVIDFTEKRLAQVEAEVSFLTKFRDTLRKNLRQWKGKNSSNTCSASQFCSLIEETEIDFQNNTPVSKQIQKRKSLSSREQFWRATAPNPGKVWSR